MSSDGDGSDLPCKDRIPILQKFRQLIPFQGGAQDGLDVEHLPNLLVQLARLVDHLEDLPTLEQAPLPRLLLIRQRDLTDEVSSGGLLQTSTKLQVEGGEGARVGEGFER